MLVFIDAAIPRLFYKKANLAAPCYSCSCLRYKDVQGGGIVYPLILNLDTRWGRGFSFTPSAAYLLSPEKSCRVLLNKRLGGPPRGSEQLK
jgi:hypothetical protein